MFAIRWGCGVTRAVVGRLLKTMEIDTDWTFPVTSLSVCVIRDAAHGCVAMAKYLSTAKMSFRF